jgi:hypothetical protein
MPLSFACNAALIANLPMQTLHISLLSDSEADADGEDKPLAETARKRPVRAAAVAAQSLSQQLAGLKGAASCFARVKHESDAYRMQRCILPRATRTRSRCLQRTCSTCSRLSF